MTRVPYAEIRGQSEAVGVVLLLGILILSLGALGVLGASSFDQTKSKVSVDIVEHEIARLAGELEDVASGNAPVKTVPLELDGADSSGTTVVREEVGSITIEVGTEEIYSGSLGTIEYENSGVSIAYQGGGVWRHGPTENSQIVVAPPFSEKNLSTSSLSLPITVVLGVDGLSKGVVIEQVDRQQMYPSLLVPEDSAVTITIQSRYYQAWSRFFVERLDFPEEDVQTIPSEEQVTVTYGKGFEVYLHVTVSRVRVFNR